MTRALGAALLGAAVLAGCSTVSDAADSVGRATDKAGICVQALQLAGFTPNLDNPEQAARDAKKTSEDLAKLANEAPDVALKHALTDMSHRYGELGPGNLTPSGVSQWATRKVATFDALTRACAP